MGEGTRCWFGNQFSLTAPRFAAYGVDLWVPELGGKFEERNPSHKMLMSVLGGMTESERQARREKGAPTTGARPGASHPAHPCSMIIPRTCTCPSERCLLQSMPGLAICSTMSIGRRQTVEQLAAVGASTSDNVRMEQARNKLAGAETRIRRLQQAIEAGANPVALVDALNRAEDERQAARADLDRIPTSRVLSVADVAAMIDELGDVGQALDRADPASIEDLYSALRLEMLYDAGAKTVNVTIRPGGRGSARVRGGT